MQTEILWNADAGGPLSFAAMRSALAAFLFARSQGVTFTVRTAASASIAEVARLRRELCFLGTGPDEIVPLQPKEEDGCCAAAAHLITEDRAYCGKSLSRRQVLFRLPERPRLKSVLIRTGHKNDTLHSGTIVDISLRGIVRRSPEKVQRCAFSAMPDLVLRHTDGHVLFCGANQREQLMFGKRFCITGASQIEYSGLAVRFRDALGREVRFPLEQLADPVLIDGNGRPSPLLTGVLGVIERGSSVIAAGDMSPEYAAAQTLLFDAFGYPAPDFLLLPPLKAGSLPDYGKLRKLGIVPEVLFHELARLVCGGAPPEKVLSCREWIRRMRRSSGVEGGMVFEQTQLIRSSRSFLQSLPEEEFCRRVRSYAPRAVAVSPDFPELAAEMQSRTSVLSDAAQWKMKI